VYDRTSELTSEAAFRIPGYDLEETGGDSGKGVVSRASPHGPRCLGAVAFLPLPAPRPPAAPSPRPFSPEDGGEGETRFPDFLVSLLSPAEECHPVLW
jgi:hypothetical protein